MHDKYVFINRYIESFPFFLYWELDVMLVAMVISGMGFMFTTGLKLLLVVFIGIMASSLYKKMKNYKAKGFAFHIIYMLGLKKTFKIVPSYQRIFHGG